MRKRREGERDEEGKGGKEKDKEYYIYLFQVNFMSSQMVSSTTKQAMAAAQDDMKLLEEKARAVSEETKRDKTKTKTMSFVK